MMNKNVLPIVVFSFLTAFPLHAQVQSAGKEHSHSEGHEHAHHVGSESMVLNDGRKWKADAPLQQGMKSIHTAVMQAVPVFHDNRLKSAEAKRLSAHINKQVNYLIENCKLPPQADATLHVIIAELLSGADTLAKHPQSMSGLPKIVGALNTYPDYFQEGAEK